MTVLQHLSAGVLSSKPALVVSVISLLSVSWAISSFLAWRRLRHIPGPRWAAFSKWWMLRNTLSGKLHLETKAACKKYGKRHLVSAPSVPTASFPSTLYLLPSH